MGSKVPSSCLFSLEHKRMHLVWKCSSNTHSAIKKERKTEGERERKEKGYLLPAFQKPSSVFISLTVKPAETLLRVNKY